MRVLMSSFVAIVFAGSAAGESVGGFLVGKPYVCATESAHYQNIESGASGVWSNAPKSMRLQLKPCDETGGGICSDHRSRSMHQLQYTVNFEGEAYSTYLEGTVFGFSNGRSLANLKGGKFYYIANSVLSDDHTRAAFTLLADCFLAE